MTPSTRDPQHPGRRQDDGTIRVNPARLKTWITLAVAAIGLLTLVWNALASQVVRPRALEAVVDSLARMNDQQDTFGAIQTRQNARLSDVEARMARVEDVLAIVAINACTSMRQQRAIYAYQRAKCDQYLGGQ